MEDNRVISRYLTHSLNSLSGLLLESSTGAVAISSLLYKQFSGLLSHRPGQAIGVGWGWIASVILIEVGYVNDAGLIVMK